MIDFAAIVGRITGKGAPEAGSASPVAPKNGVATGGAFATLVRHVQTESDREQAKLRLVVDNGALAVDGEPLDTDGDETISDDATDEAQDQTMDQPSAAVPIPVVAAAPVVASTPVVTPPPATGNVSAPDSPAASLRPTMTNLPADLATAGEPAPLQPTMANLPAPVELPATNSSGQHDLADVVHLPKSPRAVATALPEPVTPDQAATADAQASAEGASGQGQAEVAANVEQSAQPASKPGIPGAPLLPLASRAHIAALVKQADGAAPEIAPTESKAGETTPPDQPKAGQSTTTPLVSVAEPAATLSQPLRAIVDGLPPVLQSQLGAQPVHAVAGPATGQALGDQVIDMGVSGQWIDRMAREIAGLASGTGHSRFTLTPPHLGRLQIDLWQGDGATNVRLLAETDEAAQRLSNGRPALQADARIAALSLGTITVEKAAPAFDTSARDHGHGQRQSGDLSGQQQQQQQQAEGQAQSRAGNARGSDWVSRIARDESDQQSDAATRTPGRATNGRIRFA